MKPTAYISGTDSCNDPVDYSTQTWSCGIRFRSHLCFLMKTKIFAKNSVAVCLIDLGSGQLYFCCRVTTNIHLISESRLAEGLAIGPLGERIGCQSALLST